MSSALDRQGNNNISKLSPCSNDHGSRGSTSSVSNDSGSRIVNSCKDEKEEKEEKDEQQSLSDASTAQCETPAEITTTGPVSEKTTPNPESPYHVFTIGRKRKLVYIVSIAAMFSPLSANIYFPALGAISNELNVSISLVALTVTVYMIIQGIAPSFWGPLSDTRGRRITFIGTFAVYLVSNIGLAFSNNFAMLMLFRAVQAAGSAATISIGAGVIGDIATPAERGGLIGIFGGIRTLGQSIGPVFGGIILHYFDFHAIFWFLTILASITVILILFFLPETLRDIAGNGNIRLTGIHKPLYYPKSAHGTEEPTASKPAKINLGTILSPLRFLAEKDVFVTLFFGAVVYTIWSMVTSSTTALFQGRYNLNGLHTGLVFLPNGAGCVAGSYLTGIMMDRDYKSVENRHKATKGLAPDAKLNKKASADFPIEESRLKNAWWIVVLFIVAVCGYGWSISTQLLAPEEMGGSFAGMTVPLILQFVIAYTNQGIFNINSALVIDLYPGASASATAVNNLVRCSLGAVGVAVVQFIIEGIGAGFTFLMFGIFTAVISPSIFFELKWGPVWRRERMERLAAKEAAAGDQSRAEEGKVDNL